MYCANACVTVCVTDCVTECVTKAYSFLFKKSEKITLQHVIRLIFVRIITKFPKL